MYLKLYYSPTSPYARKVLVVAKELKLGDSVEIITTNPFENSRDFVKSNPLSKVWTRTTQNLRDQNDARGNPKFAGNRSQADTLWQGATGSFARRGGAMARFLKGTLVRAVWCEFYDADKRRW